MTCLGCFWISLRIFWKVPQSSLFRILSGKFLGFSWDLSNCHLSVVTVNAISFSLPPFPSPFSLFSLPFPFPYSLSLFVFPFVFPFPFPFSFSFAFPYPLDFLRLCPGLDRLDQWTEESALKFADIWSPFCHPLSLLSTFCRPFVTLLSPSVTLLSPFYRLLVTLLSPFCHPLSTFCHPLSPVCHTLITLLYIETFKIKNLLRLFQDFIKTLLRLFNTRLDSRRTIL